MRDAVDTAALEQAAEREIRKRLTACQIAIARYNMSQLALQLGR